MSLEAWANGTSGSTDLYARRIAELPIPELRQRNAVMKMIGDPVRDDLFRDGH